MNIHESECQNENETATRNATLGHKVMENILKKTGYINDKNELLSEQVQIINFTQCKQVYIRLESCCDQVSYESMLS